MKRLGQKEREEERISLLFIILNALIVLDLSSKKLQTT
jgi:hypothetical protein